MDRSLQARIRESAEVTEGIEAIALDRVRALAREFGLGRGQLLRHKMLLWMPRRVRLNFWRFLDPTLSRAGSHAREPAAWEPPLLEILDLLRLGARG